jgi:hypothetical protein
MMVFLLIEKIVVNFMFVMVVHNQFVGVKMECFGMKQKLVVAYKVVHHVLVVERNGEKMKVIFYLIIEEKKIILNVDTTTMPTISAASSQSSKGNYTCRSGATGFFADPSSCSIYHWCVLGTLQSTHRCNAGLHFSSSANGCLWPKDAEC